jgi:7-carboxy-7-deazaguanine synthase
MAEFVRILSDYRVDLFTNGSQALPPWAFQSNVSIVMDWKLQGSGEFPDDGMRKANLLNLQAKDGVKFVVKDKDDLEEADTWGRWFQEWDTHCPVWVGACWGQIEDAEIVEFIRDRHLDWRLNVQMHNHIWNPQERGR